MDKEKTNQDANKTKDDTDNKGINANLVVKEIGKQEDAIEPNKGEDYSKKNVNGVSPPTPSPPNGVCKRFEMWLSEKTKITDWLIVAVTTVIAVTGYLQWREIRSGSKDTHDLAVAAKSQADAAKSTSETTKEIANRTREHIEATNRLATQAKRSVNISDNTLKEMRKLAVEDRRPWIGLYDFYDKTDIAKKPFQPTVIGAIANSGKTPALDVRIEVKCDTVDLSYKETTFDNFLNPHTRIFISEMAIPPSGRKDFVILDGIAFRDDSQDIRIKAFIIFARITYFDTSRKRQYNTDFCLKHVKGFGFHPCGSGQDMK